MEKYEAYLKYISERNFDLTLTGTIDEQITKIETVLDKFDEFSVKRTEIRNVSLELKKNNEQMRSQIDEIAEIGCSDDEFNTIHDNIVDKRSQCQEKKIAMMREETNKMYRVRQVGNLEKNEATQIEQWTGKKVGCAIYDTFKDDFKTKIPLVNIITEKSQLVFVIEDTEGNKFGYYLATQLEKKFDAWIPTNEHSFTFSLKSNGRLPGPMKFEQLNKTYGYYNYSTENGKIAFPGYDIYLGIESKQNLHGTRHNPTITNLHGIENPLTGRAGNFILKRFVVIQMN